MVNNGGPGRNKDRNCTIKIGTEKYPLFHLYMPNQRTKLLEKI